MKSGRQFRVLLIAIYRDLPGSTNIRPTSDINKVNCGKCDANLVGGIIFANLLSLPLPRYQGFVERIESSPLFMSITERHGGSGSATSVTIERLSPARARESDARSSGSCIGGISKRGKSCAITYSHWGFNRLYMMERMLPPGPHGEENRLLHSLRRINSRNMLTHSILQVVIDHQMRFLVTGDMKDLRELSQTGLADMLSRSSLPEQLGVKRIDPSWICRLTKGISVNGLSGDEIMLKGLLQNSKDINQRLLRRLLEDERESLEVGMLKNPYTDEQIRDKLAHEQGIQLSRSTIHNYRREMRVPSSRKRALHNTFSIISVEFSGYYPLTFSSVHDNAPASGGVYEISLKSELVDYPLGSSPCIYIGSTKNLAKRLDEHMGGNNRNGNLVHFVNDFECSYRYVTLSCDLRKEEGRIYDLFVAKYSAPPKCNRVRPG